MRKLVLTRRVRLRGVSPRHGEAVQLLQHPGDISLVQRGHERSVVIACPDGCGEVITVNLDAAAGPAWHLYRTSRGVTLYPSVWRDSGCRSHFIVWNSAILWLDGFDEADMYDVTPDLEERVLRSLKTDQFTPYVAVANQLQEIPWTILWTCQNLVARKAAERGTGERRDWFRRTMNGAVEHETQKPSRRYRKNV